MGGSAPDDNSDIAAEKSGKYSLQQSREETMANRPDQYNPFGSVTWEKKKYKNSGSGEGGVPGSPMYKWTQTQNLNDQSQRALDNQHALVNQQQMAQSGMLGDLSEGVDTGQFGQADMSKYGYGDLGQFGGPQDLEYDPTQLRNQAQDAAYQYATNRLDPQFEQQAEQMEIKLRNQGLRPGDQVYDSQMSSFNNSRNDAYEQARLGSYDTGRQEAGQLYQQQLGSANFMNQNRQGEIDNYMSNIDSSFSRDQQARQQAIDHYLRGREQTVGEFGALDPSGAMADTVSTFSAGG